MKQRRMNAWILALLISVSTVLTACSSEKNGMTDSDTADSGSADKIRQEDTVGGETDTEAAPPVVLPPVTEAVDTEVPAPTQPDDDPSQEIPSVEMPEDPDASVIVEPDPSAGGALSDDIGQTASGRFVSEQSEKLLLCIDWESVIGEDGMAEVTVTVGISHYRLYSREKFEMGAIQVDGNAVLFSTPAIEYEENTKTYTEFYTATYTTERSEMEVEASWQVLGKYGDVEIDTLTAGGTIVLTNDT